MLGLINYLKSDPQLMVFIFGALGGLISLILNDGCLELPKKIDGKIYLGGLSALILGALAGYFTDGSLLAAFIGGFTGKEMVTKLLNKPDEILANLAPCTTSQPDATPTQPAETATIAATPIPIYLDIETMIRAKAAAAGVKPDLAVAVAHCESGLNPSATNKNKDGSIDRGLYQWNNKYHPEITDEMAFNPETATDLFLKAIAAGHLSWWSASQKCWSSYQ